MDKDDKDSSKEQVVKKTLKGKLPTTTSSQDKMIELMLASMALFNEKLTAMDNRIAVLAEKTQDNIQDSDTSKKFCFRKKSKKCETSDVRQETFTSRQHSVIQSDTGIAY